MDDTLEERVDAIERALTDGHADDGLPDAARMETRLAELDRTAEEVDDRLSELEATVQALRGFVGGVDAVDESVERRANAAVARVERLEAELRDGSGKRGNDRPGAGETETTGTAVTTERPGTPNPSEPYGTTGSEPTGDRHVDPESGAPNAGDRGVAADAGTDIHSAAGHDPTPTDGRGARRTRDGATDSHERPSPVEGSDATTLAAAAADTARNELDAEPEPTDRTDDSATTLAERIRRLL
ncbi:DUF7310 family coiled-coil domain-containing protein [Haloplanus pelagicus]|jgi:hypothetical protein|uniref:DUF7310 family coiled-coil domain-containing protein n=1 Tax=Haloplanus pelagicus TaxID=2949995 RepID=UPI00203EC66E|nr:hypothetical protein [Haloplanus sp. HW8-1]